MAEAIQFSLKLVQVRPSFKALFVHPAYTIYTKAGWEELGCKSCPNVNELCRVESLCLKLRPERS